MVCSEECLKVRINMISESEMTIQSHGVHTAYKELTKALSQVKGIQVDVNSKHSADIVHIQTVGLYALSKLYGRVGRKVVSAHIVPDSLVGSIKGAKYWKPLARYWLKHFYGRADLVLACSKMVKDELESDMGLSNVGLLYNTIDMSQYRFTKSHKNQMRKKLSIRGDEFVVLGNGQIQPRKRFDVFVNSAKALPEMTFIWVGGIPFKKMGAEYGKMMDLVDKAPVNLTVTGVVSLPEVAQYYAVADVFMLPAVQENHPMSVLEASGAGIPIVLRDIPQYDDTFRGYSLMGSDEDSFVCILKNLKEDKALYREFSKKSLEISKKFDSRAGALTAVSYYQSLLK